MKANKKLDKNDGFTKEATLRIEALISMVFVRNRIIFSKSSKNNGQILENNYFSTYE